MLKLYSFPAPHYTLLVLEQRDFKAADLKQSLKVEVDTSKGVILAAAPEVSKAAIANTLNYYRFIVPWVAVHEPGGTAIVWKAQESSGIPEGSTVKVPLPCLECYRNGETTLLGLQARHPYCVKHTHKSPHRCGSRRKKNPKENMAIAS